MKRSHLILNKNISAKGKSIEVTKEQLKLNALRLKLSKRGTEQ